MKIIVRLEKEEAYRLSLIKLLSNDPEIDGGAIDGMKYRVINISCDDNCQPAKSYLTLGRIFAINHGFSLASESPFSNVYYPKLMKDLEEYDIGLIPYFEDLYPPTPEDDEYDEEDDDFQDYEDDYPEEDNDND